MAYQVWRRAHNAAAYSDRSVRVGKPVADLRAALLAALACQGVGVRVEDGAGRSGSVSRIDEVSSWRGVDRSPRIALSLPPEWFHELVDEG